MFERFTDRARKVVVLAQEGARTVNHNYVGTEHLLWGLVNEGEGVAHSILKGFGIDDPQVDQMLQELGPGTSKPIGHIPFTSNLKKTLEMSLREALQLGHNYIGTEHLLLGICRMGEGTTAYKLLDKFDITLSMTRQAIIQMLAGYKPGTGKVMDDDSQALEEAEPTLTNVVSKVLERIVQDIAENIEDEDYVEVLGQQRSIFLAGWKHQLPDIWKKYELEVDPEYNEYLRLKKKFG